MWQSKALIIALATVASQLTAANPLPALQQDDSSACTTTVVVTDKPPEPPKTWQPTWTVTVHRSTTTTVAAVDCGDCNIVNTVHLDVDFQYPTGPHPPTIAIVTATTPATVTQHHCKSGRDGVHGHLPLETSKVESMNFVKMPQEWQSEKPLNRPDDALEHVMDTEVARGVSSCTKRILQIPKLLNGPTMTYWTSTSTTTRTIDCGACRHLEPTYLPLGVPPVVHFHTAVFATEPTISTVFACATSWPSSKRSAVSEDRNSPHFYRQTPITTYTATPVGIEKPSCTTRTVLEPVVPNETLTNYNSIVTQTRSVNCHSCKLEWSTGILNFFAPIRLTKTVDALEPSTRTVITCARATPSL